jgi:hypothetical protein
MKKLAGFLVILAMVAVAPSARADLQILVNGMPCTPRDMSQSNPLPQSTPNGSLTCQLTVASGVTIVGLAAAGLQTGSFSQQFGTSLLVANTTNSAVTITIDIGDSNFSSPVTPPNITHNSGSTINGTTGTNSLTLTSCVDLSNALSGCGSPAPGMAPANGTVTVTGGSTAVNSTTGTITSLASPFSLTQHIVISVGANSNFNFTTSQVLTPTVAPGTACPMSPGFWKNHPFPAALTFPVTIGGIPYSSADFKNILNNPGGGNAVQILGFQLVAALANAANGATVPASIAVTIAHAEGLLSGPPSISMGSTVTVPPSPLDFIAPSSTLGQQMVADAAVLDTFNNTEQCTLP